VAPLVVLLVSFGFTLVGFRTLRGRWSTGLAGRAAAAVMFVFTGTSHFIFPAEMAEMVPSVFPSPRIWVAATGVAEILGGVGLLVPRTSRIAAWALALFLVAVFPANVYAAINEVGMGGHRDGTGYLWLRGPLQVVFLAWVGYFGFYRNSLPRDVPDTLRQRGKQRTGDTRAGR